MSVLNSVGERHTKEVHQHVGPSVQALPQVRRRHLPRQQAAGGVHHRRQRHGPDVQQHGEDGHRAGADRLQEEVELSLLDHLRAVNCPHWSGLHDLLL